MTGYTTAQKAKAIVAFVGSLAAALIGIYGSDWEVGDVPAGKILAGVVAVATYVATFKIPNAPTEDPPAPPQVDAGDPH